MRTIPVKLAATRTRRRHDPEFKARVIAAGQHPGVSIAAVALANGLNANLLRRWIKDHREASVASAAGRKGTAVVPVTTGIIPVTRQTTRGNTGDIRLDLRRGELAVQIAWPVSHADHLGAWLKDLLS
jgi:transposase-like protein